MTGFPSPSPESGFETATAPQKILSHHGSRSNAVGWLSPQSLISEAEPLCPVDTERLKDILALRYH
jgi:hypothetical protein